MQYYEAIKMRRSNYEITNASPVSDERIQEILAEMLMYTPSAFHSQSARVVLLLNEKHHMLWNIVRNTLRKIVPNTAFEGTNKKITSFENGYGTILFFEDMKTVQNLQKDFALYAESFPNWSQQSSGMVQFSIWTALSQEGLGASLQHYNPLIDDEVKKTFNIHWNLISQMPFGTPVHKPDVLTYMPIEERLLIKGKDYDKNA